MKMRAFMKQNFKHFNAAACVDAAQGWVDHLDRRGKMVVTLAGAMSTAELGISLAEMIRRDKVHALCCTGANLEEDIFNLLAHDHYTRLPHYRSLTKEDELALLKQGMNRVTDTCIPEGRCSSSVKQLTRLRRAIFPTNTSTSY
jgi:deoxyhypusine synthase